MHANNLAPQPIMDIFTSNTYIDQRNATRKCL